MDHHTRKSDENDGTSDQKYKGLSRKMNIAMEERKKTLHYLHIFYRNISKYLEMGFVSE